MPPVTVTLDTVEPAPDLSGEPEIPSRSQCTEPSEESAPDAVIQLGRIRDTNIIGLCSGTFIRENALVTAASCLDESDTGSIVALIDDCEGGKTRTIAAAKTVHLGPTANAFHNLNARMQAGDYELIGRYAKNIAIVEFAEAIAPAYLTVYEDPLADNETLELAGYEAPGADTPLNDIVKSIKEVTLLAAADPLPESPSPGMFYAVSSGVLAQVGSALIRDGHLGGIVATHVMVDESTVAVIIDLQSENGVELLSLLP